MFGKSFNLFKLAGFQVRADASWLLIAFLVTWSLATGLFPQLYQDQSTELYWLMGVLGALGLFASIVVHELCHSLVSRTYGMPIKGITLFLFGGVAEMDEEPPSPAAEFWMAIAGPVASIIVAAGASFIALIGRRYDWPVWLYGTMGYLGGINLIVAVFNLVPAFPLDGGRVLRSILWYWKRKLRWATRISSTIGSGFALFLIFLGVVSFVNGQFLGGMWWFLIGMFLRTASQTSYRQLIVRRALEGEPIRNFMQQEVHSVSPETTLSEFVDHYVYAYHHKLFPVVDGEELRGCITTRRVKEVPRDEWDTKTVGDVLENCSEQNAASPDADAMKTLMDMSRKGISRLMVVDRGKLQGVLSLKDLTRFISLKLDIEEDVQENADAMPLGRS